MNNTGLAQLHFMKKQRDLDYIIMFSSIPMAKQCGSSLLHKLVTSYADKPTADYSQASFRTF